MGHGVLKVAGASASATRHMVPGVRAARMRMFDFAGTAGEALAGRAEVLVDFMIIIATTAVSSEQQQFRGKRSRRVGRMGWLDCREWRCCVPMPLYSPHRGCRYALGKRKSLRFGRWAHTFIASALDKPESVTNTEGLCGQIRLAALAWAIVLLRAASAHAQYRASADGRATPAPTGPAIPGMCHHPHVLCVRCHRRVRSEATKRHPIDP